MTEVWVVNFLNLTLELEKYSYLLSKKELSRYLGFVKQEDALLYLNSHLILRFILAFKNSLSWQELVFETNDYGKPLLQNGTHFSMSHTKGMLAIAVSDIEVGIDVENCNQSWLSWDDFDLIWSPAEKRYIDQLSSLEKTNLLLLRVWTRKEAVVKALGLGLYHPLEQVVTAIRSQSEVLTERILIQQENKINLFKCIELDLPQGFVGFVCSKNIRLDKINYIETQQQFDRLFAL